jgi:hypothetical protein
MTNQEVIAKIRDLREITRTTGVLTKRTQNELIASLSDKQLLEISTALAELFRSERNEDANPRR